MSRTSMLMRLNMATRPHHGDLDGPWLDLVVPHVSKVQYLEQMIHVFGFESAVEAALAYTPGFGGVIVLRDWARSSFAAKDLMALGLSAGQVAQLPQCLVEPLSGTAEALGWMYVVERSTLLHDGLRQHIEARLPRTPYVCSYLAANEGKDIARWNELGEIFERAAERSGAPEEMLRAADAACRRAVDWFQERQPEVRVSAGGSQL